MIRGGSSARTHNRQAHLIFSPLGMPKGAVAHSPYATTPLFTYKDASGPLFLTKHIVMLRKDMPRSRTSGMARGCQAIDVSVYTAPWPVPCRVRSPCATSSSNRLCTTSPLRPSPTVWAT